MLILGIVSMLPFPAIHLLAFLYFGACMETITVQQPFNLAVRPAGSQEFKWYYYLFRETVAMTSLLTTNPVFDRCSYFAIHPFFINHSYCIRYTN